MADIKITFQEVRAKATQLRGYNETLTSTLTTIKNAINNLESQWTSDTSDTIRAKITAMQPKFDRYKEVVESYAKFLDNTVAQYEALERELRSAADSQFL